MRYRHSVEIASQLLCAAGVPGLARRIGRGRLTIVMYHGVQPEPLSPPCWHVLDTASLRRQLGHLKRHYHVLHLADALERLYAGMLPDRAAVVTFDDGTQNLLTHALPVLTELGVPAAVFLATGPMGTDEALWPDRLWLAIARTGVTEIDLTPLGLGIRPLGGTADRGTVYALAVERFKELPDEERITLLERILAVLNPEADGGAGPFRLLNWEEALALTEGGLVTLYPHTVTHPILSRCSADKVDHEVAESCAEVARRTGCDPAVFAYPNGRARDFDERAKVALRRQGVRWALATTRGIAHRESDPLALPRIGVGDDMSFAAFRLLVSGAVPTRRVPDELTEPATSV